LTSDPSGPSDPSDPSDLAAAIAGRLAEIPGIVGVTLGGSWATGVADAEADVDLGLYYDPAQRPSRAALDAVAHDLDDRRPTAAVTAFGDWGPWVDGGAWLTVGGWRVDWIFRDVDRVRAAVAAARAGDVRVHHQVGHPFGFPAHRYAGELAVARVLADPAGALAGLRAELGAFPAALRRALADRLWEAGFALEQADKSGRRGDVLATVGQLHRAVAVMVEALSGHNGRWLLNEKGALRLIAQMRRRPDTFAQVVESVLARPGATPDELGASVERMRAALADVRAVCGRREPGG